MPALFEDTAIGGVLPPTATYANRTWLYVPHPDDPDRGVLEITLQKGKGVNCKVERDTYAVEQQAPPVGFIGRAFLIVNLTDEQQPDAYQVFVGERDGEGYCTCKAGQCLKECKHLATLRAVIDAGVLGEITDSSTVGEFVLPAREARYEEKDEMLINGQNAGAPQRNDEDYNIPSGLYLCEFRGVQEIPAKEGDTLSRLVFEFELVDGPYRGKKLSTFVRKNMFAGNARGSKPSNLYKLAKSFGVADPVARFETDEHIGQRFQIVAKNEDGKRAWPESFLPVQGQAPYIPPAPTGVSAPPPPPNTTIPAPPSPVAGPADDSKWLVWIPEKKQYEAMTGAGVRAHLISHNPDDVMLCAEGSQEVKSAIQAGFTTDDDTIPW